MPGKIRDPAKSSPTLNDEVLKMIDDLDAAMVGKPVLEPWWHDCGLIKRRLMAAIRASGEKFSDDPVVMRAEARRLLAGRPKKFCEPA